MIYEIRTYNLKLGQLNEYWDRFSEKLPARQELSKLGAHWYTEVGPLNQMVAVWPYESLEQRAEIRRAAEAEPNPIWPPPTQAILSCQWYQKFFYQPPLWNLWATEISGRYMKCVYTPIPPEGMPQVLEAWSAAIPDRLEFSPLAGCWYSEYGGTNNFIHVWAYKSFEERARVRAETREKGVWPSPKAPSDPSHKRASFYCLHLFHRCSDIILNVDLLRTYAINGMNVVWHSPLLKVPPTPLIRGGYGGVGGILGGLNH